MARKKSSFLENTPSETDDFGDLGPVVPADEKPVEVEQSIEPDRPEPSIPKADEIVLRAEDIFAAVKHGDSTGLPLRKGFDPRQAGREIILAQDSTEITAAIAGHAVDCVLVHEVRLSSWRVRGKAQELSGKYRLENDIKIVLDGRVLTLKKGKEFFDHQISVAMVRQAGGIVLPIGTQE